MITIDWVLLSAWMSVPWNVLSLYSVGVLWSELLRVKRTTADKWTMSNIIITGVAFAIIYFLAWLVSICFR